MTSKSLCQWHDWYVRTVLNQTWNQYCAKAPTKEKEWLKKQIKQIVRSVASDEERKEKLLKNIVLN